MYEISIILPVFNVEQYIIPAFNSIFNQTFGFDKLEVIFVDDCSTDGSAKVIKNLSDKYDNVKYYCLSENSGAAGKPRNFGIGKATSDYLMFLDPDDVFVDDACEKLYNIITNDDLDVVSGGYLQVVNENLVKNDWGLLELEGDRIRVDSIKDNYTLLRFPASVWAKIFRKKLIVDNNIKFPEGVPAQDLYFVSHCLIKSKGILFVDTPIVKYIPRTGNNASITSKRDKFTLSAFIKVYIDLFHLLKEFDENCSWIAAVNLYFWTNIFLSCDLNVEDKIDLLKYAQGLFIEFKKSSNLNYKVGHELFFECVCDGKFYDAILEANKISLYPNISHLTKSKPVLMIFFGFDLEIGGLARAVFNRANSLSERGYDVTLLNIDAFRNDNIFDSFKNFKYIESYFKSMNFLNESVNIVNMFDYFSERNTIDFSKIYIDNDCTELNEKFGNDLLNCNLDLSDDYFIYNDYIVERIITNDQLIIFNYYEKNIFKENITSMYNFNNLIFLKDFDIGEHNPRFSKTYMNGFLVVKTDFVEKKVDLFTSDGFNYCTITNINNQLSFKLNDRFTFCSLNFNYKEFYEYFTNLYCFESKNKPFLINDCPGPRPSIANVNSDVAYKISNIHCNHHNSPFNCGSPIKKLGAFENIEDLDAIVFLTESQKNDFKKECNFKEVYNIANFIPDMELNTINTNKNNFNKNKISVFARVSPEKNLADIIKAFKKVTEVKKDAILEIYGRILINWEIKEHKKLLQLINELHLEKNVIFRGHVDNVAEEMADSLVTVFTSEAEGLGLVVLESMVNCTPVIAYDLNYGPRNIITDGEDGFLVPQGDIDQLSNKIIEFLNNPSKSIEMGVNAQQKIIEKFSESVIINHWENLLETILINNEYTYCHEDSVTNIEKDMETELKEANKSENSVINKKLFVKNQELLNRTKELNLKLGNLENSLKIINQEKSEKNKSFSIFNSFKK